MLWPLSLLPLIQSAVCTRHTGRSQILGVYVSLIVLRQMVAPHKAFLTLAALKALVSCEEKANKRRERHEQLPKIKNPDCACVFQETDLCESGRVVAARRYV